MKVQVIANNTNEKLGELSLIAAPRHGEWLKLNEKIYAIHRLSLIHISEPTRQEASRMPSSA